MIRKLLPNKCYLNIHMDSLPEDIEDLAPQIDIYLHKGLLQNICFVRNLKS